MVKPRAILDSSSIVSAIGWRGDARRVLRLLAAGGFESYRTPCITAEWTDVVTRVAQRPIWKNPNWVSWLTWLKAASKVVEDIPIKPTVKRDPKDDPVVLAAVAARAGYIVTTDGDLLDLEKPYGVECLTPLAFLSVLLRTP